jgi:hypothetical protein
MNSVAEVIYNQKDPIAYRIKTEDKTNSPIGLSNRMSSKDVDFLLQDCGDLIVTSYTPWFAKRFYMMNRELIQRLASEARQDGKNPGRLFYHLINKNCG